MSLGSTEKSQLGAASFSVLVWWVSVEEFRSQWRKNSWKQPKQAASVHQIYPEFCDWVQWTCAERPWPISTRELWLVALEDNIARINLTNWHTKDVIGDQWKPHSTYKHISIGQSDACFWKCPRYFSILSISKKLPRKTRRIGESGTAPNQNVMVYDFIRMHWSISEWIRTAVIEFNLFCLLWI